MRTLLGLLLMGLVPQERPEVLIVAGPPQDRWPLAGTIQKPDGTELGVSIVRYGRRWDAGDGKFHEAPLAESRQWVTVEVKGTAFRAVFPKGMPGLYKVSVTENVREIHAADALLGKTEDLFSALPRQIAKLEDLGGRFLGYLEEIEALSRGSRKGSGKEAQEFEKRLDADRKLLAEIRSRADLPATLSVFDEVYQYLTAGRHWERFEGEADDAKDDQAEDAFTENVVNTESMRALLRSGKRVLSLEVAAVAARVLEELFLQAQQNPAALLPKARRAAQEACKAVGEAPEPDRELMEKLEAAGRADEQSAVRVFEDLKAATAARIARP